MEGSELDAGLLGEPGKPFPVIRRNPETGKRQMDNLEWGLLPHGTSRPTTSIRPLHARAETVHELDMFADAFRRRRAIVPMDAYFQKRSIGGSGQRFTVRRRDHQPIGLGALWESYVWESGKITRSFCVVTIEATDAVAKIHDRMPLIIADEEALAIWLGDKPGDPMELLRPLPDGVLECLPTRKPR